MIINKNDFSAGLIFLLIAGFFGIGATQATLGTVARMGPGFFPLMLSVVLAIFGLIIMIRSVGAVGAKIQLLPWNSAVAVLATPVVFGLTVRGLGLGPAIAIVVLLGASASRQMKPLTAIALTAMLTLFCVAIFIWGLGLPLKAIGPWLGGR
jgi:hypothetical protein